MRANNLDILLNAPEEPGTNFLQSEYWGRPIKIRYYYGKDLEVLGVICQYKTFKGTHLLPYTYWASSRAPNGEWKCRSWPVPRPLYNLHWIDSEPDAIVVACNSEEAADAAHQLLPEYVPTTSPGGPNGVVKADWRAVQNRKVLIWSSNDAAGEKFKRAVSKILRSQNNEVYVLPVPANKPQGWDAVTALAEGWKNA